MSHSGTMVIQLQEAYLRRDTEMFGKMDPYVMFTVNGECTRSKTCVNAGKYPKWEQKVVFRCNNNDMVKFQVMDEEFNGKDDLIGEGEFCYELNDRECLFKAQNTNMQLYYKSKNAGELKMVLNFYSDQRKHKNLQQQIQEQLLLKEQQAKQAQMKKQQEKLDKLAKSNKNVEKKLQIITKLEDEVDQQKEDNKNTVKQIQEMIREQENSQLQTEVINEQMDYNRMKNQLISSQMQKFQDGKFIGKLSIQGFKFEFITGLDSNQNIELCFMISSPNSQQVYNLPAKKQDRKSIKWDQNYDIKINNGHSVVIQAYHSKEKRLIGIGNIPLMSIGRENRSISAGIYKQESIQANLICDMSFEQVDQ